jgi:hypothetical protein
MVARKAGDSETGTGFACAKLSGGQKPSPPVAYAPVVGMTQTSRRSICQDDTRTRSLSQDETRDSRCSLRSLVEVGGCDFGDPGAVVALVADCTLVIAHALQKTRDTVWRDFLSRGHRARDLLA